MNIEWHKARQNGIGGSDVGAIMGVNPYKTAYDVWIEKTSPEPVIKEDNAAMKAGRMLEEAVGKWFADETGFKLVIPANPYIGKKPYYIGNIDYLVETPEGLAVLECKITTSYARESWETEVPLIYYLQLQHYLNVTGLEIGYIAVLVDGRNFVWYKFTKDADLLEVVEMRLDEFWNDVQTGTMPPPQNNQDIVKQYPNDSGTDILAVNKIEIEIQKLLEIRQQIKKLEQESDAAELIIKSYMGDAAIIKDAEGQVLATWKATKPTRRFDAKRFQAENPDMYKNYLKEAAGSRRFVLKGGQK